MFTIAMFVVNADCCNIRAECAKAVIGYESITKFITQKLNIKVNSPRVRCARNRRSGSFLGFSFTKTTDDIKRSNGDLRAQIFGSVLGARSERLHTRKGVSTSNATYTGLVRCGGWRS